MVNVQSVLEVNMLNAGEMGSSKDLRDFGHPRFMMHEGNKGYAIWSELTAAPSRN